MNNPWKLATLGIGLTAITALGSGLTTAYVMRSGSADRDPRSPAVEESRRVVSPPQGRLGPRRAEARPVAAAPVRQVAASREIAPAASPVLVGSPTTVSSSTTAGASSSDCATTGDRMWRIAKPGLIGGVVGAGVGAAGGAIASGSKGAGKGALIGALIGTTAGAGYGAYRTKNECGTIFGGGSGSGFSTGTASRSSEGVVPDQAALHSGQRTSSTGSLGVSAEDEITVYSAR